MTIDRAQSSGQSLTEVMVSFSLLAAFIMLAIAAYTHFDKSSAALNKELAEAGRANNEIELTKSPEYLADSFLNPSNSQFENCVVSGNSCPSFSQSQFIKLNTPGVATSSTDSQVLFSALPSGILVFKFGDDSISYSSRYQFLMTQLKITKTKCPKFQVLVGVDLAYNRGLCSSVDRTPAFPKKEGAEAKNARSSK